MKESSSHTPGPWHLGIRAGQRYIYGPLGEEVAGPSTFTSGHDETLANARLIAAAPELLEALEDVMSDPYFAKSATRYAHARAAISKAKGGTA